MKQFYYGLKLFDLFQVYLLDVCVDLTSHVRGLVFYKHSIHLLKLAKINQKDHSSEIIKNELELLESEYQSLKLLLLRRGAEGTLSIAKMDKLMTSTSQIRRINQQAVKALIHFESLNLNDDNPIESEINGNITHV